MKRKILWFLKAFVALIVAVSVLSGFCAFYYNLPVHLTSQSNATDYYWEKNSVSIRGTEGFAKVGVDGNGYVNTYPQKNENIDILVMGSSHTEGFNVAENENYVYLMNEKFASADNDMYVYNIGTSGHTLERCLRNFESAVSEFSPEKYVVIETTSIAPALSELKKVQENTLEYLSSYDSGLVYYLQKIDLFRLLFSQFSNVLKNENLPDFNFKKNENSASVATKSNEDYLEDYLTEYEACVRSVLEKTSDIAVKNNVKLIIAYVPHIEIDYNGDIVDTQKSKHEEIFESVCKEYNIGFVDMTEAFSSFYSEEKQLLQGFSNTGVGVGHINKYGHAVIADELYSYIMEECEK